MKIKDQYIFRQVADEYLLIPVGEAARNTNGLISLSESGCLMYRILREGCTRQELIDALLREYDAELPTVSADVDQFLDKMRALNMLEEEPR